MSTQANVENENGSLEDQLPPVAKGSFQIQLQTLTFKDISPDFLDRHGLSQGSSLYAKVDITNPSERSNLFWFTNSTPEENEETDAGTHESEDLQHQTYSEVFQFSTEKEDGDEFISLNVNYSQKSRAIELLEQVLALLLQSAVKISLFAGETTDAESSRPIGTVQLPLLDAILATHYSESVTLTSKTEESEQSSAESVCEMLVEIGCDNELADYVLGSRVITISNISINQLPPDWRFELQEDEDPRVASDDTSRNTAIYSISMNFPFSNSTPQVFENGRLVYHVDETLVENLEDEEAEETDEVEDVESPQPSGEWLVRWSNINMLHFYTKATLEKINTDLMEHLLLCQVQRKVSDKSTSPTDEWNAAARLSFEKLYEQGIDKVSVDGVLEKGVIIPLDELEKQLNDTANPQDKKAIQARIDDYESMLTRTAGQAAVMLSAQSTLHLSLSANAPIVERPPTPPKPILRVSEVIPTREPLQQYPKREACVELGNEIKAVAIMLLKQYEKKFMSPTAQEQKADNEITNNLREDRRKQLIYHLNTEGVYHDFKETLKKRIIHVVRERFPEAPSDGGTDSTACKFYSELYVYLMDQVNSTLNEMFALRSDAASQNESSAFTAKDKTIEHLLRKAQESENSGNFAKANECHLKRIAYAEDHAQALGGYNCDVWYDCALFCLRRRDLNRACECLRQCLSINSDFHAATQVYGALLCEIGDFEKAEILIKNAVKADIHEQPEQQPAPSAVISHGLLALYYDQSGGDKTGNLTKFELMHAKNSNVGANATTASTIINLAAYLIDLKLEKLTSRVLDLAKMYQRPNEISSMETRVKRRLVDAKLHMLRDMNDEAGKYAIEAIDIDNSSANAWFLLAQVQYAQGNHSAVIESLSWALEHQSHLDSHYILTMYLQLGELYLQASQLHEAKEVYLKACTKYPTASTWLGVGLACMRLEDWNGAEQALAEANILDNENAEVWGYLSLLCLSVTPVREQEAFLALDQAIRRELQNAVLLREIGNGLMAIDKLEKAEVLLRKSLSAQDSSLTRRRLADVLSAQNCAELALKEYQTTLEANEDIEERCVLLVKCAELLVTLGRQDEASEYRRMAQQQQDTLKAQPEASSEPLVSESRPAQITV